MINYAYEGEGEGENTSTKISFLPSNLMCMETEWQIDDHLWIIHIIVDSYI